ncbi:glycosyltransferase sugar-binding region containing DXD motif family protein, partial [Escherichia coli]|nr:glycosyltransferase sugar-binding region containing DXD motif family protein [Escherichia coli]
DDDLFFNRLFDEVFAKYNDNIYQKVKKITDVFKDNQRVAIHNIDRFIPKGNLLELLHHEGYPFSDLTTISRYLVTGLGVSGIHTTENILPAPSSTLLKILKGHYNHDDVNEILPQIYKYLLNNKDKVSESIPTNIRDKISQLPTNELLMPIPAQSITPLGISYSSNNGKITDQVMACVADGFENPLSEIMNIYLADLYKIHVSMRDGTLNEQSLRLMLTNSIADCFLSEQSINKLLNEAKEKPYQSLTEIHQHISSLPTLADAT